VQDNGPGIEPAFQDRIFGAFTRLHGKEYPGNGLGLAFCKRAVEWRGGRMWLKSAPGSGSTFYFNVVDG
jgi:signal transduction histidine kinase